MRLIHSDDTEYQKKTREKRNERDRRIRERKKAEKAMSEMKLKAELNENVSDNVTGIITDNNVQGES